MYLQGKDSVYDIQWNEHVTYGQIYHQNEVEQSRYNFDESDAAMHREHFDQFEAECLRLTGQGLLWPAYDYCLKCSHTFNLLDARGAISITERTGYIGRVRTLASVYYTHLCCTIPEMIGFMFLWIAFPSSNALRAGEKRSRRWIVWAAEAGNPARKKPARLSKKSPKT